MTHRAHRSHLVFKDTYNSCIQEKARKSRQAQTIYETQTSHWSLVAFMQKHIGYRKHKVTQLHDGFQRHIGHARHLDHFQEIHQF